MKAPNIKTSREKEKSFYEKSKVIYFTQIKKEKEMITNGRSPETGLWKAVIMQSVLDIMSNSNRAADILAKKISRDWFNIKNENFVKVCGYANLQPEWVLKKVDFALKNPKTWRRECDLKKTFLK